MNLILQGFYSFCCVAGFSIIFNLPRKVLIITSVNGAIGWIVYVILQQLGANFIIPAFVGSFVVGIVGEVLAIKNRHPATLFIIPGITPFVPGYGIYNTMYHIVTQNFSGAITEGAQSMFIAISIACGVVLATSLVRMTRTSIEKVLKKTFKNR
ncbi:threonine/serine exporter family protein [Fusibacter sp. JL298sf-3]